MIQANFTRMWMRQRANCTQNNNEQLKPADVLSFRRANHIDNHNFSHDRSFGTNGLVAGILHNYRTNNRFIVSFFKEFRHQSRVWKARHS